MFFSGIVTDGPLNAQINVRLTFEEYQEVEALAKAQNRPVSAMARLLVHAGLDATKGIAQPRQPLGLKDGEAPKTEGETLSDSAMAKVDDILARIEAIEKIVKTVKTR